MIDRIKKRVGRGSSAALAQRQSFRERYEEIELRRAALLRRIQNLNDEAKSHPAYRRAFVLLTKPFAGPRWPSVSQSFAPPSV